MPQSRAHRLLDALRRFEKELELMTMDYDIFSLGSEMSPEELRATFPSQVKRSARYADFVTLLSRLDIGGGWKFGLPEGIDPDVAVRDLKYNLTEAAKERKTWKTAALTEDEATQFNANKKIDRFERSDGSAVTRTKDGWKTEVTEPVMLTFHVDTKTEERDVTDKDGKVAKKQVKVPLRVHILLKANTPIRHRASRATKPEDAPAETAPTETPANGTSDAPVGELQPVA